MARVRVARSFYDNRKRYKEDEIIPNAKPEWVKTYGGHLEVLDNDVDVPRGNARRRGAAAAPPATPENDEQDESDSVI